MRTSRVLLFNLLFAGCALAQQRQVGSFVFSPPNVLSTPLTVNALAGQTAPLQNWKDSSGMVTLSVTAAGVLQGKLAPTGVGAGQLLYADAAGKIASIPVSSYDPSTLNLALNTNNFTVQAYARVGDMLSLGNGIQFDKAAETLPISALGQVRMRNLAGVLQLSNNAVAYQSVVVGQSTAGRLTVWLGTNQIGGLALSDGQLAIGSTGLTPVAAGLTAGTAIGIATGAGSITISNTGVTSAVAGTGISVSAATGAVTITNTAPNVVHGTTTCVTSVDFMAMTTTTATCLTP